MLYCLLKSDVASSVCDLGTKVVPVLLYFELHLDDVIL